MAGFRIFITVFVVFPILETLIQGDAVKCHYCTTDLETTDPDVSITASCKSPFDTRSADVGVCTNRHCTTSTFNKYNTYTGAMETHTTRGCAQMQDYEGCQTKTYGDKYVQECFCSKDFCNGHNENVGKTTCHACKSHAFAYGLTYMEAETAECLDPFVAGTTPSTGPFMYTCKARYCVKISGSETVYSIAGYGTSQGRTVVQRHCTNNAPHIGCRTRTVNNVDLQECYCEGDMCNTAAPTTRCQGWLAKVALLLLTLVLSHLVNIVSL